MDSWTTLLSAELPLETSSKPAVFNEVQRRATDPEFKSTWYKFATDLLGDDLKGGQDEFTHWDVVKTRYIVGKGSALRGQASGNWLEDKIQDDILESLGLVEGEHFVHVGGRAEITVKGETFTLEKGADFVIPGLHDAKILIEAKAYMSSTGSKQTDALGDVSKLESISNKGVDFYLMLDGPMWRRRQSDLVEAFKKMDDGTVTGIYQSNTIDKLKNELRSRIESMDLDIGEQKDFDEF
jgi:hypothetical protein